MALNRKSNPPLPPPPSPSSDPDLAASEAFVLNVRRLALHRWRSEPHGDEWLMFECMSRSAVTWCLFAS
ncbi:hypothetical protein EYF80_048325 [Liparis tanakae]|uniref:Uncharacterized protein n=1 Tax=Liparis tanakae TaxID=230148 RepID=A0A4Z2FK38_9TELE|nr:hypothetical protein EYF80_048325 [Liparis tanakae]